MGRTFHADSRVQRCGRVAAEGRAAGCAIWQRLFRLHWPRVFPGVACRCAGGLPPICEFNLTGQMNPPKHEPATDDKSPGVPGFRTWRGVYWFVFGFFVQVVTLLAIFSRWFA